MMKVPYIIRLPGVGKIIDDLVIIPDDISILSLNLKASSDGKLTGTYEVIDEIGKFNNVSMSDIDLIEFIALWNREHIKSGGMQIDHYDDIKKFFWDALGFIKYPENLDFNNLFLADAAVGFQIDYGSLIDVLEFNEIDLTAIAYSSDFIKNAYYEYVEMGGVISEDLQKFITIEYLQT